MHYYKFHIGDYRKDTSHLTLVEHAIYRALIDTYYETEQPLSGCIAKLMRSHCVRTEIERESFNNVLSDFFTYNKDSDCYHHAKCDELLSELYARSEKARQAAFKSHESKRKNKANAVQPHSEPIANAMQPQDNSKEKVTNGLLPINPLTHYPLTQEPINPLTHSKSARSDLQPESVNDQSLFAESKTDQETTAQDLTIQEEETKRVSKSTQAAKPAKSKFTPEHKSIAEELARELTKQMPKAKINIDNWAKSVRLILDTDKRPKDELVQLWQLVRSDTPDKHLSDERWNGWAEVCRAPDKLRKVKESLQYYDIIKNQLWPRQGLQATNGHHTSSTNNNGMHESGIRQKTVDDLSDLRGFLNEHD